MKLSHFFLPHPHSHKKAHLISWKALTVYLLLLVGLKVGFNAVAAKNPEVLGISSNIDQKQVIELTNEKRQEAGLSPVIENSKLDEAALAKAKNMFEEDYWAHYSPSGKDPWGFINGAGYKFVFAGENLARNFYTSPEVVEAWMNSPTHRDNLLNSRFQEIGVAVVDGILKGKRTILVVQEFGTTKETVAAAPSSPPLSDKENLSNPDVLSQPQFQAISLPKPLIDPFATIRYIGLILAGLVGGLLVIDLIVIKRRAIYRVSSRHVPQLVFLTIAIFTLIIINPGGIL